MATTQLDLFQIFKASPFIYSLLFFFSLFAFTIWLYSLLTLRRPSVIPPSFVQTITDLLVKKEFDKALKLCKRDSHYTAQIIASGLLSRNYGHEAVIEAMQKEGKRCGITLWQRIALINDVTLIAPMLGLLGTVLGLFYAFYDVNRSPDTLASIFDGLGVAVGTTVAGLLVAIFSMVFYATLKFRVVRLLNSLENETLSLSHLIEKL